MDTTDYSQLDQLPPTEYELAEARHLQVTRLNAERERRRLARANRAAGHPEPKVGDKLYVSVDRTVMRRGRSGLKFERGERSEVTVVAAEGEELLALQKSGKRVVSVHGAELLYEDMVLNVYERPGVAGRDAEELRQRNDQLEEETRLQRVELEQLRKERAARMAAPDSKDGAPARLNAARAVKDAAVTTKDAVTPPGADFGVDPKAPAK